MFHYFWRILFVVVFAIIVVPAARAEPPEISLIEPSEGYVGQKFKIVGDHLAKTRSIKFYFGHNTRAAQFRALSENELEVTVPENAQRPAEAILVLDHPEGIAVTCPAKEIVVRENQQLVSEDQIPGQLAFLHVIRGGALRSVSATTLVEEGGIVNSVSPSCPLVFVKKGGVIGSVSGHSTHGGGTVFCESGARVRVEESRHDGRMHIIHVKSIHVAEGIGPFVFQPVPLAAGLDHATESPVIVSVRPAVISPGDILTVKGSGFAGVTAVYIIGQTARASFARIVSDTELRVETPDTMRSGRAEVLVINKQGAALTVSSVRKSAGKNSHELEFNPVSDGKVLRRQDLSSTESGYLVVVERGGVVLGGHATFLVKDGGTITAGEGTLFHESNASIPVTRTKQRGDTIEVPTIRFNKISTGFEFATSTAKIK